MTNSVNFLYNLFCILVLPNEAGPKSKRRCKNGWGKRRLAYPINDLNEGYYVLINFSAAHDFPAELDRIYKITDGILRSIIIAK